MKKRHTVSLNFLFTFHLFRCVFQIWNLTLHVCNVNLLVVWNWASLVLKSSPKEKVLCCICWGKTCFKWMICLYLKMWPLCVFDFDTPVLKEHEETVCWSTIVVSLLLCSRCFLWGSSSPGERLVSRKRFLCWQLCGLSMQWWLLPAGRHQSALQQQRQVGRKSTCLFR